MVQAVLWVLRQRRYTVISAVMLVVALGCVGAGTFELHRYHEKRSTNDHLVANTRAATVPVSDLQVPVVRPSGAATAGANLDALKYRRVSATGTYDEAAERYVSGVTQGGHQGFLVLTPLRTTGGALLVARGFVAATANETRPARITAPPTGTVTVTARLYPGQHTSDRAGVLGNGEITSVNVAEQAERLGVPTFAAYGALVARAPGTVGLTTLSGPDLSNPSGGAGEVQLLSYVVQWYVFAVLAVLAPFLIARSEVREARRRFLGADPDDEQFDDEPFDEPGFDALPGGRTALAGASGDAADGAPGSATGGGRLAVREPGALARQDPLAAAEVARAERIADRYGRSLGLRDTDEGVALLWRSLDRRRRAASARDSRFDPHRSDDEYHAQYNDELWRLALADGDIPPEPRQPDPTSTRDQSPRIVDVDPLPDDGPTPPGAGTDNDPANGRDPGTDRHR